MCVNNNKRCIQSFVLEQSFSQAYGMCYAFIQNSSVAASGPTYGLQVQFNLEMYENMDLFSTKSGLKLHMTPPGLFGDAENAYVDWDSSSIERGI